MMDSRKIQNDTAELLVDERTAAKLLGISDRHLFTKRTAGEVPFMKIGCRILYSPTALAAWIAERQIRTIEPVTNGSESEASSPKK